MSGNAHASRTADSSPQSVSALAYEAPCRYCDSPVYVAICSDGRWRTFGKELLPAAEANVWAWRKRQGMQETERAPGHGLHFCAEYAHVRNGKSAFDKESA